MVLIIKFKKRAHSFSSDMEEKYPFVQIKWRSGEYKNAHLKYIYDSGKKIQLYLLNGEGEYPLTIENIFIELIGDHGFMYPNYAEIVFSNPIEGDYFKIKIEEDWEHTRRYELIEIKNNVIVNSSTHQVNFY